MDLWRWWFQIIRAHGVNRCNSNTNHNPVLIMAWHELPDLILRIAFWGVQCPHPEQRRWNADLGLGLLRGKDRVLAGSLPSASALWPRCGTAAFQAQPTGFCSWCSFSRNAVERNRPRCGNHAPLQTPTPDSCWSKARLGSETRSQVAAADAQAWPVFLSLNVFRRGSRLPPL